MPAALTVLATRSSSRLSSAAYSFGPAACGLDAGGRELLDDLRLLDDRGHLARDLLQDRRRRAGARVDADDRREGVARNEFGDRRHVRRHRRALGAVGRQQRDVLGADRAAERRIGRERHIDVTAEQRRNGFARALERHVRHDEAERRLQRLHRQMMRGADAGRAVVELAGIGLHVVDELLHRLDRHLLVHGEKQRRLRDHHGRRQIADAVGHLGVDVRVDGVDRAVLDDEGGAVRRRAHQRRDRDARRCRPACSRSPPTGRPSPAAGAR